MQGSPFEVSLFNLVWIYQWIVFFHQEKIFGIIQMLISYTKTNSQTPISIKYTSLGLLIRYQLLLFN